MTKQTTDTLTSDSTDSSNLFSSSPRTYDSPRQASASQVPKEPLAMRGEDMAESALKAHAPQGYSE